MVCGSIVAAFLIAGKSEDLAEHKFFLPAAVRLQKVKKSDDLIYREQPLGDKWLLLERVAMRDGRGYGIDYSLGPIGFHTFGSKGNDTTETTTNVLRNEFGVEIDGNDDSTAPPFITFGETELKRVLKENPLVGKALDKCYSTYCLSIGERILAGGYRVRPWLNKALQKTTIADGWFIGVWYERTQLVHFAVEEGGDSLISGPRGTFINEKRQDDVY
jgi:hypothetical protein